MSTTLIAPFGMISNGLMRAVGELYFGTQVVNSGRLTLSLHQYVDLFFFFANECICIFCAGLAKLFWTFHYL